MKTKKFGLSPHSPECGPVEATTSRRNWYSCPDSLRTLRSAAPLKHVIHRHYDLRRGSLRTLRSAAPLKLHDCPSLDRASLFSPHSPECGPVEAAPAEQPPLTQLTSPHSPECGPVEAGRPPFRRTATPHSLRTLRSAAPLKRARGTQSRAGDDHSPHSPECGPVAAKRRMLTGFNVAVYFIDSVACVML